MPGEMMTSSKKPYLKIIQGKVVLPSKEGEENAVKRDYEDNDGNPRHKWEIPYLNWTGVIKAIRFKDSDYGEMCNVEFEDSYLQMNTSGRYFQDFACKIFNVDLSKPVTLHPYDMEVDGKKKTGISLQQDGQKLKNYFYDPVEKKNLHGFPDVDQEKAKAKKKTYWKVYFTELTEFLVEKVKELKFAEQAPKTLTEAAEEAFAPEADPLLNDLPF